MTNGTEIYFDGENITDAISCDSDWQRENDVTYEAETITGTVYEGELTVRLGTLQSKYNINKKVLIL